MSQTPSQKAIRGAYGRGYFDGLKELDEHVNHTRMTQAIETLNAQSKKVYEAVPNTDAWTCAQVGGELARQGLAHQPSVVLGILGSLVRMGLVQEPSIGHFVKVKVKPAATRTVAATKPQAAAEAGKDLVERVAATNAVPTQAPATSAKPDDTLTTIARLSAQVREAATDLLALASGLDDVAIAIEERIAKIDADSATLRQLQALLKTIGVGV